jgi:hypothetical protein
VLWRKVLFFSIVGVLVFESLRFFNIQLPKAQRKVAEQTRISASLGDNVSSTGVSGNAYQLVMRVDESGDVYVNNKKVKEKVTATAGFDELRYVVLDGANAEGMANAGFYDTAQVIVKLPKPIKQTDLPETRRRLIGAHGVTVQPSYFQDNQTLVLPAVNAEPSAILTVLIQFPQGYLSMGAGSAVERAVLGLSGIVWLILSVALLLIALLIFFYIYEKSTGGKNVKPPAYMLEKPPLAMSPALVGVLMHGRIRSKEILATVVDLAGRGALGLEDRHGELVIYKKQLRDKALWQTLRPYERYLVDEFFGNKSTLSTVDEFRERTGKELFSRRVTQIYAQIYQEATELGLFEQNPARAHLKYKIYSIGMFLISLMGFLYAALVAPDPKFVLIFWVGCLGVSVLASIFAARISTRTLLGRQHLEKWLAYRNFLSIGRSIGTQASLGDEFERSLPYAIAMDVELEWANRFSESDFRLPDWYSAARDIYDMQGFADSFFPLLGHFAEQMAFMKEPVVE